MKTFEETKFTLYAFDGNPLFFMPTPFYRGQFTPSEAWEYCRSRDYDIGILSLYLGPSLVDAFQYVAYYKKGATQWEMEEKWQGLLLRYYDQLEAAKE